MDQSLQFSAPSPDITYDEEKMALHRLDSLSILIYTCLLSLTVITIWVFEKRRVAFIHETGLAIIFGLAVGAILRYAVQTRNNVSVLNVIPSDQDGENQLDSNGPPEQINLNDSAHHVNQTWVYELKGEIREMSESIIDKKATFDPEIFFNVILPPIIFNAGYSLKRKYFFRNFGSIFAFAFLGSTISTFTVGGIMYGVTQLVPGLENVTFIENLHFGALISATDPVTVLAIFSNLHVDVTLHALVFGESVLNDATAVVFEEALKNYEKLYSSCNQTGDQNCSINFLNVIVSIVNFFYIFGCSFIVGSAMGCLTALLTKFTSIRRHPMLECTLMILMSYSTFLLAEVIGLSGIVSVLFCGICQAHYTYNNLSAESQTSTKTFFGILNFMAENFIFSYIGVSMFTFPKHKFNPFYITGAFGAIFLGRLLNVYPLSAFLNIGRKVKITPKLQHMLMFSGLRGAIAFALAMRNTITEGRQMILTTTMIIVIVTVIFNGGLTLPVVNLLGIPTGVNDENSWKEPLDVQYQRLNDEEATMEPVNLPGKSCLAKLWGGIDNKLFKPLLTHTSPSLMETLPRYCLMLGKYLSSEEQENNFMERRQEDQDRNGNKISHQ